MRKRLSVLLLSLCTCSGGKLTGVDSGRYQDSIGPLHFSDSSRVDRDSHINDVLDSDSRATAPAVSQKPFGINMPDLLHAYLGTAPADVKTMQAHLDKAKAAGFTHIRFMGSPYWPVDMTTGNGWVANPTAFFAAFDAMVADIKARQMTLVVSLLWNIHLFPDVVGEPLGQLFVPGSKTRQLAEKYIREVVTRYAGSGAILFWEMGNEFNLAADIDISNCNVCPGFNNRCGGLYTELGTPCKRTSADNIFSCNACRGAVTTQQDLGQFTASIAQLIASLDPNTPFSSGNAYPRPSAWHLGTSPCPNCDWTLDTPEEYGKALAQLHPVGVPIISVHHYSGSDAARFGSVDEMGIDLLIRTQAIAKSLGKQLYVGEHGETRIDTVVCGGVTEKCGGDINRGVTRRLLDAMVGVQVPYAALWAFQFNSFCADVPNCYSVGAADDIIAAVIAHNQAAKSCLTAANQAACPIGRCSAGICKPVRLGAFTFDNPSDESAWQVWTNCTACTPGTLTRLSSGPVTGQALLTTHDLSCTGSCVYPGTYAVSPLIAATPGQVLVQVTGRSTTTSANQRVIAFNQAGQELQHGVTVIANQGAPKTAAVWSKLPSGTDHIRLRLELTTPRKPAPGRH